MVHSHDQQQGLEYWLRWQVPVCALIFLLPTVGAFFVIFKVKKPHLNSTDLWIPCWRGLHPIYLLIYRALVFSFMSWLLYRVAVSDRVFAFYFYTQWTFTLVIVYFALGTIISAHGCWEYLKTPVVGNQERDEFLKKHSEDSQPRTTVTSKTNEVGNTVTLQRHHEEDEVKQQAGFWGYLMLILYQTCAGASMLTDIVFWCLLLPFQSDGNFSLNLLMGAMHGLNLLFLLLDTALNNLPFPWFRMAYFVFWSCTYILFQWILHASGVSWWPYAFLELSTPWAPMWYLAIALIHLPCFGFYVLVVKVKNSIFSRVFPRAYLRSY